MSAVRLVPLLVVLAVLCACLPLSAVGQPPTTLGCLPTQPDDSYGTWTSDGGSFHIIGFSYYKSTDYNILCAFRIQYKLPNGATDFGPWHGSVTQDPVVCKGPYLSTFKNTSDWAQAGTGSLGIRTNEANGRTVVTNILVGRYCSVQDYICAGVGCAGSANYATEIAALQADPTYRTINFTAPLGGPAGTVSIFTSFNATAANNTAIRSSAPNVYPDKVLSVITSLQSCYGQRVLSC